MAGLPLSINFSRPHRMVRWSSIRKTRIAGSVDIGASERQRGAEPRNCGIEYKRGIVGRAPLPLSGRVERQMAAWRPRYAQVRGGVVVLAGIACGRIRVAKEIARHSLYAQG